VARSVADSARFDPFGLVDAALAGEAGACVRMLGSLREEGVAPPLVLWALVREIRLFAEAADACGRRGSPEAVFARHRVWKTRQRRLLAALRARRPGEWRNLLGQAVHAELVVKGQRPGDPWGELIQLALALAGVCLPALPDVQR